jgi:competence ComEA-like helix-hairpin-helix protein
MRQLTYAIVMFAISLGIGAPSASAQTAKAPAAGQSTAAPKPASASRATKAHATPAAPVNLNSANLAQLQTLPGVGASAAQRILDYRQKFGPFKKPEEILETARSCPFLLSVLAFGPLCSVSPSRQKSQ